ncbi:DUF342 domain-containing protein [Alicyclobacillus cycloheptanicus]|uniref:Flagellar Assembly Protein A N-terminal region domain-containing protein n=1 Tax=Alicyclobacillus cycloheptanicus TaxID=1457 RepID=A0ABT9XK91_9BACL|nr:FapA family protein [Alicyclobacillus cycloheptanicus]MDQ0190695.1 hypothetical protein [Alicyclobacillus cycloheptanicus]WDM00290.1 DUF342 domain-containing protein [Alicyclobacillus cycloheptanicus]
MKTEEMDDIDTADIAMSSGAAVHGTVTIRNNEVFVTNPEGPGSFATLVVPRDTRLRVYVDDEERVGRILVHAGQTIRVELEQVDPAADLVFRVSEDRVTVSARLEVSPGHRCFLQDVQDVRHALLEVGETETWPELPRPADVLTLLERQRFVGTVDTVAIEQLCQSRQGGEATVLRGIPVLLGKPPTYVPVPLPAVYDPLGRRMRVDTVSVGTTIATIEPGEPSTPGVDVYGRVISPPTPRPATRIGEGVKELAGRLVAVRDGRPVFTSDYIDVLPELLIPRDVTAKDGHIEFDGDVFITGSVLDGCFIKATGSIRINGAVLQSRIMGEQGVFVGGSVIGSQVIAGQSKFIYQKWLPLFRRIRKDVDQFRQEYLQLLVHVGLSDHAEAGTETMRRRLADVLLERRHHDLAENLHIVCEDVDGIASFDDRYKALVSLLKRKWTGISRTRLLPEDVEQLRRMVGDVLEHMEASSTSDAHHIRAGGVTSSSVRASGNISVMQHGVYVSTLESGSHIVVKGSVRGGFLTAQNAVRVDELGTPLGTESSVQVKNVRGVIGIGVRHPNTLLQVGRSRHRNAQTQHNVVYRG